MSATFADDVVDFLAAQGVGTVGSSLYQGQLPPEPLDAVLVVETGGRAFDRARRVQPLTLQVTARATSYAAARAKAWAIHALLNDPPDSRLVGSTRIAYSRAIQPPFSMGQDGRQAWRVACNYEFLVYVPAI